MALHINSLTRNISAWDRIGVNPTVRTWITDGVPLQFSDIPSFYIRNQKFTKQEYQFLQHEIQSLLKAGLIESCNYKPICVSPLKCVPKKSGGFRMVTNLFHFNQFIHAPKFQYENIQSVGDVIQAQDQLVTLDLKNGFFHIKVLESHRDYLGFEFHGCFYRWAVCPFGLCSSPYYFNKVLKVVTAFLREQGIRSVLYVDDILVLAQHSFITDHRDFVLDTLCELGFCINYEKCCLTPSCQVEFIGYIINSCGPNDTPWLYIPFPKIKKLKKDIKRCMAKGFIQARSLAKICGQAIAMSRAVFPGKLKLRHIYALLSTRSSWSDQLPLNTKVIEQLNWWLCHLDGWNGSPLLVKSPDAQVWTDASDSGWGCVLNDQEASGIWDSDIVNEHINFKELITILYALLCFKDNLQGKTVKIMCDNTTSVAYIKNLGGPTSKLTELAEAIWAFALQHSIVLQVMHVPGISNVHADHLSRLAHRYEWQLNPGLFNQIDNMWGPHTVDRFASFATTQLPIYNSRFLDPMSSGVDALSQLDWGEHNNYVNAPFRLLNRVIQTLINQRAYATIIAPYWPNQAWCQEIQRLLIAPPLRIRLSKGTIWTNGPAEPLKNRRWKLFAWRVHGGKN
jgi:hypothetical protein